MTILAHAPTADLRKWRRELERRKGLGERLFIGPGGIFDLLEVTDYAAYTYGAERVRHKQVTNPVPLEDFVHHYEYWPEAGYSYDLTAAKTTEFVLKGTRIPVFVDARITRAYPKWLGAADWLAQIMVVFRVGDSTARAGLPREDFERLTEKGSPDFKLTPSKPADTEKFLSVVVLGRHLDQTLENIQPGQVVEVEDGSIILPLFVEGNDVYCRLLETDDSYRGYPVVTPCRLLKTTITVER